MAFMKMGHFQLASRPGLWGKHMANVIEMDEIGIGLVVRNLAVSSSQFWWLDLAYQNWFD